jgi:hypothetical protein
MLVARGSLIAEPVQTLFVEETQTKEIALLQY